MFYERRANKTRDRTKLLDANGIMRRYAAPYQKQQKIIHIHYRDIVLQDSLLASNNKDVREIAAANDKHRCQFCHEELATACCL